MGEAIITTAGLVVFLVAAVIVFFVFLICRELVCWYFKINENLEVQRAILTELQRANPKSETHASIGNISTGS